MNELNDLNIAQKEAQLKNDHWKVVTPFDHASQVLLDYCLIHVYSKSKRFLLSVFASCLRQQFDSLLWRAYRNF